MKKHYLVICITLIFNNLLNAQDYYIDQTFNSGSPYELTTQYPNLEVNGFEKYNDSIYLQLIQTSYFDPNTNTTNNENFVKSIIILSDGSVNESILYTYVCTQDQCRITDVTIDDFGNVLVIVSYLNTTSLKYTYKVIKFQPYAGGTSGVWTLDSSFGSGGTLEVTDNSDNYYNPKIVVSPANGYFIASQKGNDSLSILNIDPLGTTVLQNKKYKFYDGAGFVRDLLVSNNKLFIGCNGIASSSGNSYTQPYVIKLNLNGTLDSTFATNGKIELPAIWVNTSAPSGYGGISKIEISPNNEIYIAGNTVQLISGYFVPRGRISKYNSNGLIDNSFANSGTFDTNFSLSNWSFEDMKIINDGNILVSGFFRVQLQSSDPENQSGFFMKFNPNGNYFSGLGNNGFMYSNSIEYNILSFKEDANNRIIYSTISTNSKPTVGRLLYGIPSGIDESKKDDYLTVFPNPAKENLTIESKVSQAITIYNSLGTIVLEQQLKSGVNTISVNQLINGIYFIQTENGTTQKFVKQ